MPSIWRMLRAAPFIAFYKLIGYSSSDYRGQWDSYWSSVESAGVGGQVIWDSEDDHMMGQALELLKLHGDTTLPLLDFGCGNGRRSAWLAQHFDRVICADVSQAAVALAEKTTCAGLSNVEFEVLDMTDTAGVEALHTRLGDVNVHARGVLHLIKAQHMGAAVGNLHSALGEKGSFYLYETDGTALEYLLTKSSDSASGLPAGMHKVIQHGIMPHGFGAESHEQWFSDPAKWVTIAAGPTTITTIALGDGEAGAIPSFYALLQTSSSASSAGSDVEADDAVRDEKVVEL